VTLDDPSVPSATLAAIYAAFVTLAVGAPPSATLTAIRRGLAAIRRYAPLPC
jgi:hypothetical protein